MDQDRAIGGMAMIELFEQNERMQDRQSSKGNQLKWENAGIWYKADYTGASGLSGSKKPYFFIRGLADHNFGAVVSKNVWK